jgi:Thiamine biosynthesis protein (ThiI)
MKICTACNQQKEFKEFNRSKASPDGYEYACKSCRLIKVNIWRKQEEGFIRNLYSSMKKRTTSGVHKNAPEEIKKKHRVYLTIKEFEDLWKQHKEKYGYKCSLTGVEMTHVPSKKGMNISNNISADRLDPNIGYTKENIIFISANINTKKNAVTKELCHAILKQYEERGW